ncbi:hypothetical protein [Actinacidiphila guanduensis]|uniref:Uncharacterized protein n=1 Tax=Actinacidiphila guanduensis TaxID=310781 RepID=A0A1H0MC33_9ACTN|nr:hypothetical protein [Actinacidiphila guanduensis]SDO78048.1 hypothetical protein SAMN05216259_112153 [Actinacidiphila guanduensis]
MDYTSEPPPGTAEIWTGTGPIRALPPLVPDGESGASATADNGDVGGDSTNAEGSPAPVIWTCGAVQQALQPASRGSVAIRAANTANCRTG